MEFTCLLALLSCGLPGVGESWSVQILEALHRDSTYICLIKYLQTRRSAKMAPDASDTDQTMVSKHEKGWRRVVRNFTPSYVLLEGRQVRFANSPQVVLSDDGDRNYVDLATQSSI